MGESVMECTVLGWLVKVGDTVAADDSILEVATDKVDTEVPSPYSGTLVEVLVEEGQVVKIGSPVAKLQVSESDKVEQSTTVHPDTPVGNNGHEKDTNQNQEVEPDEAVEDWETHMASHGLPTLSSAATLPSRPSTGNDSNNGFFSPLVLSIAKEEGVGMEELLQIKGSGAESRVTKKDLVQFLETRTGDTAPAAPVSKSGDNITIVEMNRMRRMISQRMTDSKNISAHVTSFIETDMTPIVKWRERVKDDFRRQTGTSITYTPILIEAVIKAIKEYPLINVSVDGNSLLLKKDINIGMAVALPDGNLIVPVIHQADQYSLIGLAKKVNDLAKKARENKLKADDLTGGTFTISNIGTFGNLMGTPIIVQPQVAIMAFGAIVKKPAVIETPEGDLLGIRNKMFISHSYDHRVVDGSLGGMFLKKVSDILENFDSNRPIL
ncbi:dihydrolipoamide acetyltransferase component of pyruvate dehydrogenase complex [Persicitalea jodogahamensis]|uniref:Dihydrolipoamide acetyltransferase component of pyruvate dehydrogenase complex n=2 Tax=Persicitalea jodogahamensis TaxID=402147 RepID=A0A8J3DCE3_9BACT|nr:dihydrolipoamide acetyltransferase component of pyruvate dehydrogenase complex [Persicitalea jodogahamensis]